VAGLLPSKVREQALADEIESHIQLHIDDNVRAGMTPEEARREAILKLGGIEHVKEAYRDRNTIPVLEHLTHDIRYAIRQLRKNRGFACVAMLVLALGFCASVSIFAFVDAALIKPLPYTNPNQLVAVAERTSIFLRGPLSYPDYLDWKALNKVLGSLEVYTRTGFLLSTQAGAISVQATRVSDGFFRTLGVRPVLGRDFYKGEGLSGTARPVLMSYATWQKRYGGKKTVIGQGVSLSGIPFTVIGVLPREFEFAPGDRAEFWTTLDTSSSCATRRSCHNLDGIARLKDDISVRTAAAGMISIAKQLEKQYPDSNRGQGASVVPLSDVITGDIRPILLVLLGGAGLLLLIACSNVASLLLVRAEARTREVAVRRSLGASHARLISQFFIEGAVLVLAGAVLGLASAHWAIQLLTKLVPEDLMARTPFLLSLGLNVRVLAFAGTIAFFAAVLFSLTPAMHFSRAEMRKGLAEGSWGSSGNAWRRLGSKLVVLELATAMVLLAGAGLLAQSLYRLLRVELGFQPDHLATLVVAAPDITYGKDEAAAALGRQIVRRAASLPGVKSAGIASQLPVSFNGNTDWIRFVGKPYNGEHNEVNQREVSSGYFRTIGAKLLRGRYFAVAEDASKPRVVIINQALAKKYFPGEDPIGKQFGDSNLSPSSIRQIIGVMDDIKEGSLDSDIWPAEYLPFNQSPDTYFSVVVRTSQAPDSVLPALSAAVHRIDSNVGTIDEATMAERINGSPSAWLHRSSAWLVGGFAGLALVLSTIGLYGVVAYSVSKRTREIGMRIALGAEQSAIYRLILKEAAWLTLAGVAIGVVSSVPVTTFMRNLLFGVQLWDTATLLTVAAVLGVSALLASYIPARRAASVNPLEALRAE